MSAYFVVQATIKDEPQYQKYREAVVPFIARFGGKIAARGAKVEVLEGEHDTRSKWQVRVCSVSRRRAALLNRDAEVMCMKDVSIDF